MKIEDAKVGMNVRFIASELHSLAPVFYPEVGTTGVIVEPELLVQWEKGSTSGDDKWYAPPYSLEPVEAISNG